jgi:ribonuclease-3
LNFLKYFTFLFSKEKKYYREINNLLGFYPGNIALYKTAFRHKSAAQLTQQGFKNSNERMEYLGDAIFGSVIAHYLFKKFPYKDEGFLTKMRSRIASREFMNKLALKMGINQFITFQGGRNAKYNSINGDAFEALIGAIYLDRGYDFTEKYIIDKIINLHVDMEEIESTEKDFKSKLINYMQKEKIPFNFNVEEDIKGKQKLFNVSLLANQEVLGQASDISKKRAEQQASQMACEKLKIV